MSSLESLPSIGKDSSGVPSPSSKIPMFWLRFFLASAVILIPCLWHHHIEAGDLGSHVYNAWLAKLVHDGRAPGLWLAVRWNNVFFDFLLTGIGSFLGWVATEKIATGITVLIFVWGAFAFVSAATRQTPWRLLPCLAVAGYGWVFEMGFMNCYLSLGLAFLALAILVGPKDWRRWLALLLAPLIWLAHPLGLAVFVAFAAYAIVTNSLSGRQRLPVFLASASVIVAVHLFIRIHYRHHVSWTPPYVHDGFDQLLLFGPAYLVPARLLRTFVWICILLGVFRRRREILALPSTMMIAELYALTFLGVLLLPTGIDTERFHRMGFVSIGFLTERLTIVLLVLICCLAGMMRPPRWQFAGYSLIAILFFAMLYKDTDTINRTEDQLESIISTLPANQRVLASVDTFPASNVGSEHIIDRACIERCFSYSNYEPKVAQFRVRANEGNSFVLTEMKTVKSGRFENYIVQQKDVPLREISWCDATRTALCTRVLAPGDATPVGLSLDRAWVSRFSRKALILDLLLALVIVACGLAVIRRMEKARTEA